MPTNQITHSNHYVPQFYLKNWSQDGVSIFVYNLLVPNTNVDLWNRRFIKSSAVWNDFYTLKVGDEETDIVEKWFNSKFETPAKKVFDKLLMNYKLDKDEYKILSHFVGAQQLRTPAGFIVLMELYRREVPQSNNDVNQIGNGMYLYMLNYILTKTINILEKHKWQVIHAAPGISFPCSDNPVICANFTNENKYDFRGGWGIEHGNIIMPISPKLLLMTEIGNSMVVKQLDYSEYWSKIFHKMIIEHAHRYIYAIEPQKGMFAINRRRADSVLFEKEKNMMAGWHDEQLEEEISHIINDEI